MNTKKSKRKSFVGYGSYQNYLDSNLWKGIRARIFKRFSKCVLCDDTAEVIHHLNYANAVLLGKRDTDLAPVCLDCHDWIEFNKTGKRRTYKEVRDLFLAAIKNPELANSDWVLWRKEQIVKAAKANMVARAEYMKRGRVDCGGDEIDLSVVVCQPLSEMEFVDYPIVVEHSVESLNYIESKSSWHKRQVHQMDIDNMNHLRSIMEEIGN